MEALDIEGPPLSTKKSEGLLGFLNLGFYTNPPTTTRTRIELPC